MKDCYTFFIDARNFPVFNSLTKRNGEDQAQLEHNIMKVLVHGLLEKLLDSCMERSGGHKLV